MKLYRISGTYFGTQAEAKPAAVDAGIKVSAIGDHEVDVPTDKAGLIAYLNGLSVAKAFVAEKVAEFDDALINGNPEVEPHREPIVAQPEMYKARSEAAAVRQHNINVEEEIASADFPTALRLAEHATSRVGEHLKAIAEAHLPKPASGYQKSATLSELLS